MTDDDDHASCGCGREGCEDCAADAARMTDTGEPQPGNHLSELDAYLMLRASEAIAALLYEYRSDCQCADCQPYIELSKALRQRGTNPAV